MLKVRAPHRLCTYDHLTRKQYVLIRDIITIASHSKQHNQRQARKLLRRKRHLSIPTRHTTDLESKTACLPSRHQDTTATDSSSTFPPSSAGNMSGSSRRQYQASDTSSVASSSAAAASTAPTTPSTTTTTACERTTSAGSSGASSQTTLPAEDNCHFAFSAELRMVDSLVSILAQNRQSGDGPDAGQSRSR